MSDTVSVTKVMNGYIVRYEKTFEKDQWIFSTMDKVFDFLLEFFDVPSEKVQILHEKEQVS